MKRIFTTATFLFFTTLIFAQAPNSCSLDPVFVASNNTGIWPDSAVNFIQGTVGMPYGQNITVKVPKDTVTSGIRFCFNRIELTTPSSYTNFALPPGLSLLAGTTVTNSGNVYKFPGNANSCCVITGTPTTAGTYTLQLQLQPYLTLQPFGSCSNNPNYNGGSSGIAGPSVLSYYVITINPAVTVGMKEEVNSKSLNVSNIPNPFSGKTTVKFNVKDGSVAKITVYNLLGDKIFEDKMTTIYGDNSYELDGSSWSNGMYLYTIQYKNFSQTKRMVLTGNR